MPVKRRPGKRRADLPLAIQMLIEGRTDIENTEENHGHIVRLVYFNEFPDLFDELLPAANAMLDSWRGPPPSPKAA